MGLLDRFLSAVVEGDDVDVDAPKPEPNYRERHKWAGQAYCGTCGKELDTAEISSRNDYNPFTGEKLGHAVKVMWCSNLRDTSMYLGSIMGGKAPATPIPTVDPHWLWNSTSDRWNRHDFWFAEL